MDVIRTRRGGVKLAESELGEVVPLRGELTVDVLPWRPLSCPHEPYQPTLTARLMSRDGVHVLGEDLRDVRLRKLTGDQLLLVGVESVTEGHVQVDRPQAWWCRRSD